MKPRREIVMAPPWSIVAARRGLLSPIIACVQSGRNSMQKVSFLVVAGAFAVVSLTAGMRAQGTSRAGSGNPISQAIRQAWTAAQKNITASAELMPEANYDFKPVESVRTFG